MTASFDLASLRERVRDALTMVEVARHDGLVLKMQGEGKGTCSCPFHQEKTASCVMGGRMKDKYHCFGCGASGDIFQYWQERRGVDHVEAVKQLAGLAGIHYGEITFDRPKAGIARQPERRLASEESVKKASLPPLFKATEVDCAMIAKTRKLDTEAVWLAARVLNRVAISEWPLYERSNGTWLPRCEAHGKRCYLDTPSCRAAETYRSWTVMDSERRVGEFRRLDNLPYERYDGGKLKAWSTAGKSWPIGAKDAALMGRVLLVEGGPDLLAGYHFLRRWNREKKVAVVCMLGASNRMAEDALPFFAGCRVRIMVDADVPKDSPDKGKRKLVGAEAALRWTEQLTEAGAAVETFYVGDLYEPESVARWHRGEITAAEVEVILAGYVGKDGSKVKDVNDLAQCSDEVLRSDDVKQAITVWDF